MCPQSLQISKTSRRRIEQLYLYLYLYLCQCLCLYLYLFLCLFLYGCCMYTLCLGNQARSKTHQQFIKTHQYSSKCLRYRTSTPTPTSPIRTRSPKWMPAVNLAQFNASSANNKIEICLNIFILFSSCATQTIEHLGICVWPSILLPLMLETVRII